MSTIHSRIKEQRIKNGYTLLEAAEKIGVREATFQRYESGIIKIIKPEIIVKLAKLFNVSPAYLMDWIDEEKENKKMKENNKIKPSTKTDLILIDVNALSSTAKIIEHSVINFSDDEIAGAFRVFNIALQKIRNDLAEISTELMTKGL